MQLEGEDDVSAERCTGSSVSQTCFNLVRVWYCRIEASLCTTSQHMLRYSLACLAADQCVHGDWAAQLPLCNAAQRMGGAARAGRRHMPVLPQRETHRGRFQKNPCSHAADIPCAGCAPTGSQHVLPMTQDCHAKHSGKQMHMGCRASRNGQLWERPGRRTCHNRVLWRKLHGTQLLCVMHVC